VLLVVLVHPELDQLSTREPRNVEQMFISTAASEILERRREVLARLRAQGVLVVETTPGSVKAAVINQYLEVKARGML
jgi:predicted nuclease with RNAse H fold